jgi:rare lipoprotein A
MLATICAVIPALVMLTAPIDGLALCSWYGGYFHGRLTASGAVYDQDGFTTAHKTLSFGTVIMFTYQGKGVIVTVTDRGPFIEGREFDLSRAAFAALADTSLGLIWAEWVVVWETCEPLTEGTQ